MLKSICIILYINRLKILKIGLQNTKKSVFLPPKTDR